MLPVAILCGGKGMRMRASGDALPKPLVEVGGRPILWHVMSLYAAHGLRRFVLLLGHGAERIEAFAATLPDDWEVNCLGTGIDTPTGGRVACAAGHLRAGTFCLTYADGVADIDFEALLECHAEHGRAATMTLVRPRSPWGVARLERDGRIGGFVEKPQLASWVNGGFMVMEPSVLDFVGPNDALEGEPLAALAAAGELHGYRHEGFWDCMDTFKDTLLLNELWAGGEAPWQPLVGV